LVDTSFRFSVFEFSVVFCLFCSFFVFVVFDFFVFVVFVVFANVSVDF